MKKYDFLKKYVLNNSGEQNQELRLKHYFYPINQNYIKSIQEKLHIPIELQEFWETIGYGFFHKHVDLSTNRFMGPETFQMINLREDFYEFDPDLDLYEEIEYQDKLIFFEVNESVYLLISKQDIDGKNAIYYFNEKIADSLEEFLIRFDKEGHYYEDDIII
ncbi:SMI1/KNR4 family protein [Aquimarina algicola]|uniref:SMI1/KNR4 family protein n=1 Tax=Aquimarina algicola TaxID=2589995 RepID=A0A504JDV2_9FLAO|nr:SMI1/KNR4 family protein [Aquimarina algicola]TPN89236.1 SMI1/KNR4 family protein [Aquimarina algicola]